MLVVLLLVLVVSLITVIWSREDSSTRRVILLLVSFINLIIAVRQYVLHFLNPSSTTKCSFAGLHLQLNVTSLDQL